MTVGVKPRMGTTKTQQIRSTCEHYEAKCSGRYTDHPAAAR